MISGRGGVGDFLFGEDAKAGGGKIGQDILTQLQDYYGGQLDAWGRPRPISQGNIDQMGRSTLQFDPRNPYQFNFAQSFNPNTAVGDAYNPLMEQTMRTLGVQNAREREMLANDYNRRGLTQTGVAGSALAQQQESQRNTLANLANQFAAQQAQQQLGAQQFGANLQQNQQVQQAAELFRQQGATDQQALQMANEVFNRQQAQNQMRQTQFSQQQMPAQNLYQLAQMSGQWNPYTAASGGALGGMVGAGMTAAGAAIGGPVGAQIGSQLGAGFSQGSQPGQVYMPQGGFGGYQQPTFGQVGGQYQFPTNPYGGF